MIKKCNQITIIYTIIIIHKYVYLCEAQKTKNNIYLVFI